MTQAGTRSATPSAVPRFTRLEAVDPADVARDRGIDPMAVSYTHLDVYKRQVPLRLVPLRERLRRPCPDGSLSLYLATCVPIYL